MAALPESQTLPKPEPLPNSEPPSRHASLSERLAAAIRTVEDFPRPGISFKDITPVCADIALLGDSACALAKRWQGAEIHAVAGIEARGFFLGPLVAKRLGIGFIPIRKPGKLPRETLSVNYELEYGTDSLEMHLDAARANQNILLVDDLLATGGTAEAAVSLLEQTGANVIGCGFIVELGFLDGATRLDEKDIFSLLRYD